MDRSSRTVAPGAHVRGGRNQPFVTQRRSSSDISVGDLATAALAVGGVPNACSAAAGSPSCREHNECVGVLREHESVIGHANPVTSSEPSWAPFTMRLKEAPVHLVEQPRRMTGLDHEEAVLDPAPR